MVGEMPPGVQPLQVSGEPPTSGPEGRESPRGGEPPVLPDMHFMIDLETLGRGPGCVILAIGAVRFTRHGLLADFYRKIDILDQLRLGAQIDPDTVEWWKKQGTAAARLLRDEACTLKEALIGLRDFIHGPPVVRVWANSPTFDLAILREAYAQVARSGWSGLDVPWTFREERDFRTLKALAVNDPTAFWAEPAHHALADAQKQAELVLRFCKRLGVAP